MKTIAKVIFAGIVALALSACNDEPKEIDFSNNDYVKSEMSQAMTEMSGTDYGPIVKATKVKMGNVRLSPEIVTISLAMKHQSRKFPTTLTFICVTDAQAVGFGHNIYNNSGRLANNATDFSFSVYPAHATRMTDRDDVLGMKFSSSDGHDDVIGALKGLNKTADKDMIIFSVDAAAEEEEYSTSVGHSFAITGAQWKEAVKNVNFNACMGSKLAIDEQFIEAYSDEDIMETMKEMNGN